MSLVSVIVPVHNAEPFLLPCLNSLVAQDTSCEIILVDDGSTDASARICKEFLTQSNVRGRLISGACKGVSHARNIGISAAHGEYVAFCDADDAYMPGALSRMSDVLDGTPDCDIVVGRFSRKPETTAAKGLVSVVAAEEAIIETLYQRSGCHESAWAKLYRRLLFDGEHNFIEGRRYEDLELCPRLYNRARNVAFMDEQVYYYRPNSASFITNWTPDRADALFAVDSIVDFVGSNVPQAASAALSRRFSAYCNIGLLALRHGEKNLARKCFSEIRGMRHAILNDRRSRVKNRVAAALAYIFNV